MILRRKLPVPLWRAVPALAPLAAARRFGRAVRLPARGFAPAASRRKRLRAPSWRLPQATPTPTLPRAKPARAAVQFPAQRRAAAAVPNRRSAGVPSPAWAASAVPSSKRSTPAGVVPRIIRLPPRAPFVAVRRMAAQPSAHTPGTHPRPRIGVLAAASLPRPGAGLPTAAAPPWRQSRPFAAAARGPGVSHAPPPPPPAAAPRVPPPDPFATTPAFEHRMAGWFGRALETAALRPPVGIAGVNDALTPLFAGMTGPA